MRFLNGGAHLASALLKFNAYTLGIDSLLMPVPSEAFYAYCGDVAAKAAESLQQCHGGTGACSA
jgi:hypothetical protein